MKSLIIFFILSVTINAVASVLDEPELNDLLIPVKNTSSKRLNGQTVTFQKTSGVGTAIQSAQLIYYTSTDCVLGASSLYATTNGSFTIPVSNLFGLNPTSAYNIGAVTLGLNMAQIQSIRLAFIGLPSATSLTFTGSCALTGVTCCIQVTCSSGTCTSASATQNVTVN